MTIKQEIQEINAHTRKIRQVREEIEAPHVTERERSLLKRLQLAQDNYIELLSELEACLGVHIDPSLDLGAMTVEELLEEIS